MRYLLDIDSTMNMVILSDSLYGVKSKKKLIDIGAGGGKKYKEFIQEICGTDFEPVSNMSKCILINQAGKVIEITSNKNTIKGDENNSGEFEKLSKAINKDS